MEHLTQIRDFINKPFIEFSIFEIGLTEILLAIAIIIWLYFTSSNRNKY